MGRCRAEPCRPPVRAARRSSPCSSTWRCRWLWPSSRPPSAASALLPGDLPRCRPPTTRSGPTRRADAGHHVALPRRRCDLVAARVAQSCLEFGRWAWSAWRAGSIRRVQVNPQALAANGLASGPAHTANRGHNVSAKPRATWTAHGPLPSSANDRLSRPLTGEADHRLQEQRAAASDVARAVEHRSATSPPSP